MDKYEKLKQIFNDKSIDEYFIRDGKIATQNSSLLSSITAVGETDSRICIMYGEGATMTVVRKDALQGISANELLDYLKKHETLNKIEKARKKSNVQK